MKQIIYTNKQEYSGTHIFDNSGSIVCVLNSDGYHHTSLSVTPEKTNEIVNYIAFAFACGYNENEMTFDNAEVNISPLIQSSEDSKNETSEKEAVDEEVLSESIDKSKPYMQTSYDSNGMRTQKSVDGVKTNYYYDSNKNLIALVKGNDTLLVYYDSDGSATSFSYNGTMYFYVKNLQGDVIRIIDLAGTEVASYVYDAWGNIKDTKGDPTVRELNPIRYRGYVYDTETSLYYLQSRYYDPLTGRFLNADVYCDTGTDTTLSTNMFAYCENNSVNYIDNGEYARKKYDATKYKNTNWITKWASKFIPNLYTNYIKSKTIFNKSFLGVGIKISVGVAAQSNSNGILGLLVSKKAKEISINLGFGGKTSFSCSAGLTWSNFYIKFGVAFAKKTQDCFMQLVCKLVYHI